MLYGASNPGIVYEKTADQITGVTRFVVMKDGSLYKARFSLTDANQGVATSDANVTFTVKNQQIGNKEGETLYQKAWNIRAEDFQ